MKDPPEGSGADDEAVTVEGEGEGPVASGGAGPRARRAPARRVRPGSRGGEERGAGGAARGARIGADIERTRGNASRGVDGRASDGRVDEAWCPSTRARIPRDSISRLDALRPSRTKSAHAGSWISAILSLVARVLRVGRGARASRPPRAPYAPARLPAATSGRSRSPSHPPPNAPPRLDVRARRVLGPGPRRRAAPPAAFAFRRPGALGSSRRPPGPRAPRGPSPPRRRGRGGGGDGEHRRHVRGPQGARAVRVRALHLRGRPQPRRHRQGAQDPRRRRRGRHRARRPVLRPPRGRTHHPGARAAITQTERARTRRDGDHGRGHRATTNDPVRAAPRPRADRSIANPPYPKRLPSSRRARRTGFFNRAFRQPRRKTHPLSRREERFSSRRSPPSSPRPPPPHTPLRRRSNPPIARVVHRLATPDPERR